MFTPHQWIDFDGFVSRHGEHGALDVLENIERLETGRRSEILDLETRWNVIMNHVSPQHYSIAA